jgi:hypothetical protein
VSLTFKYMYADEDIGPVVVLRVNMNVVVCPFAASNAVGDPRRTRGE